MGHGKNHFNFGGNPDHVTSGLGLGEGRVRGHHHTPRGSLCSPAFK